MERLEKTAPKKNLVVFKVDNEMQEAITKTVTDNNWNQSAFIREAVRNALEAVEKGEW